MVLQWVTMCINIPEVFSVRFLHLSLKGIEMGWKLEGTTLVCTGTNGQAVRLEMVVEDKLNDSGLRVKHVGLAFTEDDPSSMLPDNGKVIPFTLLMDPSVVMCLFMGTHAALGITPTARIFNNDFQDGLRDLLKQIPDAKEKRDADKKALARLN